MASSHRFPHKIRGSVVVQRRRCGKATCRCSDGQQLHESTVLSYSTGGRNRTVMLTPQEVAKVEAAVQRYRAAKAALEDQGNTGLETFLSNRDNGPRRGQ